MSRFIQSIIQPPLTQSLTYLERKITTAFPLLMKIKTPLPLLTTVQYHSLFPHMADYLLNLMDLSEYLLFSYADEDSGCRELQGFLLIHSRTWEGHYFIFTYEGIWLHNNQPIHIQEVQDFGDRLICNSYECFTYNKPLTKENLHMNNLERLQMEIAGIELLHGELLIYLEESGLHGYDSYNAASSASKKAIYEAALSVLHSIANQPHLMKNYKQDDMSVSDFSKHLQGRIKQLELKVRQMPSQDSTASNFFNLFQ